VSDQVFNIASGRETSLKQVAELLAQVMGCALELEHAPERKVNPVPRRLADTSRAKAMLDFEAMISIEQGLKTLVEWWKQEQAAAAA
jgi:UDP-glucose 4-epimerase